MKNGANIAAEKQPWYWSLVGFGMGLQSLLAVLWWRIFFSEQKAEARRRETRNILVVRLDGVGDLVLMSEFLKDLRHSFLKARIVLVVKQSLAELVELTPFVDEVIPFDTRTSRLLQPIVLPVRAAVFARRVLSKTKFDIAVNPRWDTDGHYAGIVTLFSGARKRVGYSASVAVRKRFFNRGFDRMYTNTLTTDEPRHERERNADVLRSLGGKTDRRISKLFLSIADEDVAKKIVGSLKKDTVVVLAPGGGHPRRMWPVENFIQVGRTLLQSSNAGIIIVGSGAETNLCEHLASNLSGPVINVAGRTTLREAAAIIKRSAIFVGNDSGLKHIACAVGTPVVEISSHPLPGSRLHPASPYRFGPWNGRSVVLQPNTVLPPCEDGCSASDAHCIQQISPDEVVTAIAKLLPRKLRVHPRKRLAVP